MCHWTKWRPQTPVRKKVMATLNSKNGVLGPQNLLFFLGCINPWYIDQKFIYGSLAQMVTSNTHQKKSYGHLKVQKLGFGPIAPIVFFCIIMMCTIAGLQVKYSQTGHLTQWRPQTLNRKQVITTLSPKMEFQDKTPLLNFFKPFLKRKYFSIIFYDLYL